MAPTAGSTIASARASGLGHWYFRGNVFCTFYDPGYGLNGGCWTAIKASANCYEFYIAGLNRRPARGRSRAGTARRLGGARLAPGRALDVRGQTQRVVVRTMPPGSLSCAISACAHGPNLSLLPAAPSLCSPVRNKRMYTSLEHYIDGNWVKPSGKSQDVINPVQQQDHRRAGPRLQGRPRQGAGRRRQGLQDLAQGVGLRARQDPAQGRRSACAPAPTRSPRCSPRSRARSWRKPSWS